MSEQNSEPRPFDPPVPPVPPAPAVPPVPQYGEYAPAGYVSPYSAPVVAASTNPYGVPGYGAPTAPGPATGAPMYEPLKRKRRTWDVVLTSILLVTAVIGTLAGVGYAAIFSNPAVFDEAMRSQGLGGFSGTIGNAPVILAVSHIALFVIALGLSIPLLVRGKIVVFWIPLVAGVIAAIVFWSVIISVVTSDPGFLQRYGG